MLERELGLEAQFSRPARLWRSILSNIREELRKIREELSKIWEEHGRNVGNLRGVREERLKFGRSLGGTSNIREELSKIREEIGRNVQHSGGA